MEITFLGTGTSQGVPVIGCECRVCSSASFYDKRLRTSLLVKTDKATLVIDTGPDFRQQMLSARIKDIDAVLYTHEHKDHTAGLDDLRSFNYVKKAPVDIYAEKRVVETIKREYAYIFEKVRYPGIPSLNIHYISTDPFSVNGEIIEPLRLMHHKLPVLGFKIDQVAYLTDLNYIDEHEKEKIQGMKILIVDALRVEPHISHFNLKQALGLINDVKPEVAYLVHISHKLGLHDEVSGMLPGNVFLAYDSLKICYR